LLIIAPAAPPATPPITAPLAALLHPFFCDALAVFEEPELIEPPLDEGLLDVALLLRVEEELRVTAGVAARAFCPYIPGSIISFCAFHAWNWARPAVSTAKRSESATFLATSSGFVFGLLLQATIRIARIGKTNNNFFMVLILDGKNLFIYLVFGEHRASDSRKMLKGFLLFFLNKLLNKQLVKSV
jgi:hypothetical protein